MPVQMQVVPVPADLPRWCENMFVQYDREGMMRGYDCHRERDHQGPCDSPRAQQERIPEEGEYPRA